MKRRFGFVIAVGVGLFGQASAFAQQPVLPPPPPPPPSAPPAAPPSDKPPADQATPPAASPDKPADAPPSGDSVGGQTDPNTPPPPKAAEPVPNAPPPPPPPGDSNTAPPVPPPITLPPYLTGGPTPLTILPPVVPAVQPVPKPGPGADAGVKPREKGEAYLRWRGSGISWNHAVSTTALGVGADYISSDNQQYTQGVSATFNYFLIEPKDEKGERRGYALRVATSLGFDVELTNSDITTTKYEKQLRDTPISFVFSKTLYRSADEQTGIALLANGTFILPTSPITYGQGIYFGISPRATLAFSIPLRGKDAPFLKGMTAGLGTSYTHRFSRADTPTNPDLQRLRQSTTGSLIVSDQLTGRSLNTDNLRVGGWIFLGEKLFDKDLWIQAGGGASYQFVNKFGTEAANCDLQIQTGCATAGHVDNPRTARVQTDFSIGFTFFPSADWGIGFSYDNVTDQLAPSGTRRNPFWSPDAQFSASVIVSVDAIVERLQGNVRADPVIYFGQNRTKPVAPQRRPIQAVF